MPCKIALQILFSYTAGWQRTANEAHRGRGQLGAACLGFEDGCELCPSLHRWRPDPRAVDPASWALWKLGQPISPLEVILNGSHSLHAVGEEGVSVVTTDGGAALRIRCASRRASVAAGGKSYCQLARGPKPCTRCSCSACRNLQAPFRGLEVGSGMAQL